MSRRVFGVPTCEWMSGLVWKSCVIWKRRGWRGMILLSRAVWLVPLQAYSLICTVGKMEEKYRDGIKQHSLMQFGLHLCILTTFRVLSDTHIDHGDFLRAWSWVVGSISKVTVGVFWTHVLSQMIVHLLSLFPGWEMHNCYLCSHFCKSQSCKHPKCRRKSLFLRQQWLFTYLVLQ